MFYCEVSIQLPFKCVVSGKNKVHTAIHFLTAGNLSASAIHKQLQNVYDVNVMPECTVQLWVHRFLQKKWENIHDDERSGRLSDASTDEMWHALLPILKCDWRFIICEIWDLLIDEHSIKVSPHNPITCSYRWGLHKISEIGTETVDWWE